MSDDTANGTNGSNGDAPKRLRDWARLDMSGPAEIGTDLVIENPVTEEPEPGTDGENMTWTLRGEDAPSVREVNKRHQDRRNEKIGKGKGADLDTATLNNQRLERLLAATVRYSNNFWPLDNRPMSPYTRDNARALLSDPRFDWLCEFLQRELTNRKRFLSLMSGS